MVKRQSIPDLFLFFVSLVFFVAHSVRYSKLDFCRFVPGYAARLR